MANTLSPNLEFICQVRRFEHLSSQQIHQLYSLRQAVFIVEQQAIYQDIDATDLTALHLLGYCSDQFCAYARLIGPTETEHAFIIGRVVVAHPFRGLSLGKHLLGKSLREGKVRWPNATCLLDAQLYLQSFYEQFGFVAEGHVYFLDGIEHIQMRCPP